MDDEQVLNEIHSFAVLFVVGHEDVLNVLSQVVLTAMQSIVEPFGDLEEIIATGNDLPFCWDLQFTHQRYKPVQDFSDSTAYSRGIHHLHGFAAQVARKEANLIELGPANNRPVIFKARRRRRWWRLGADARMLAPLNEMGRQIGLPETPFFLSWRRSAGGRLFGSRFRFNLGCVGYVLFFSYWCFLLQVFLLH